MVAETPEFLQVLRIDHVDDGQYKGDFIWGIVDTDNLNIKERDYSYLKFPFNKGASESDLIESGVEFKSHKLKVKEAQDIFIAGCLVGASELDGDIFVHYTPENKEAHKERIVVYKTGQEIREPIENLQYLGLNRLWIVQELGVYTFRFKK